MKPGRHALAKIIASATLAAVAIALSWSTLPAQPEQQPSVVVGTPHRYKASPAQIQSPDTPPIPTLIGPAVYRNTSLGFRLVVPTGWRLHDSSSYLGSKFQLISGDGLKIVLYPDGGWGKGAPQPKDHFPIRVDGHPAVWTDYEPLGDGSEFAIVNITDWLPGNYTDIIFDAIQYKQGAASHSLLDGILFLDGGE
jgi:hypothetical protein